MPQPPNPESETKLRIILETEYNFLVERNVIDDGVEMSRAELHDKVCQLELVERHALQSRIRRHVQEAVDIMQNEQKEFDEPYVEHKDLVDGVRIPGYNE